MEIVGETKTEAVASDDLRIPLGHTRFSWCPPGVTTKAMDGESGETAAAAAAAGGKMSVVVKGPRKNGDTPLLCGGGEKNVPAASTLKVVSMGGRFSFSRPM